MTDTSPAAVAQMIAAPWCYASANIADTLRAVAAERDALAIANRQMAREIDALSSHIDGLARDTLRMTKSVPLPPILQSWPRL